MVLLKESLKCTIMFLLKKRQLWLLENTCLMQSVDSDGRLKECWTNGLASSEIIATLILSARIQAMLSSVNIYQS